MSACIPSNQRKPYGKSVFCCLGENPNAAIIVEVCVFLYCCNLTKSFDKFRVRGSIESTLQETPIRSIQ